MNSQNPKIALYVQRPFGDKLTATFNFFGENWKVLLKYSIYLILPICVVQALFMNTFMGGYMGLVTNNSSGEIFSSASASFWLSYGLLIFLSAIGSLVMSSLIYALVKIYNDRENRLEELTFAELKPVLFRCMRRLFMIGLFGIGLSIVVFAVMGILVMATPLTLLLTIPLLFAAIIPLAIFPPIYIFEEIDISGAFIKSLRVGFSTWGGIFSVAFVTGLISNVLYGVASIPWYGMFIVKMFLTTSSGQEAMTSIGYSAVNYLFGIIMVFGIYISCIFPILGLTYQYGHSCEKMEHTSIVDDIDKFEQL